MDTTAATPNHPPIVARAWRKRTVVLAALVALGVGGAAWAADAQAAVRLVKPKVFAVRAPGPIGPDRVYDADGADMTVVCNARTGIVPLLAGWSGLRSPVVRVGWQWSGNFGILKIEPRYAMTATTHKPYALCAKGLAKPKLVKSSGTTASCGRRLALGVPFSSSWPYTEQATYAKPDGLHRWQSRTGDISTAEVLCVAPRAFKQVVNVRATARFKVGKVEASVTATCKGKRRPIAWGHEAEPMPDNTWQSVETVTTRLSVPFVSAAQPSGARGWKLTFRTADQLPAKQATKIAVHVTCGVPA